MVQLIVAEVVPMTLAVTALITGIVEAVEKTKLPDVTGPAEFDEIAANS